MNDSSIRTFFALSRQFILFMYKMKEQRKGQLFSHEKQNVCFVYGTSTFK